MKVLIVDNGTHYKKRLQSLVDKHDIAWVPLEDLDPETHSQGIDLIVLSGAYKTYAVKNHAHSIYAKERELIHKARVPVIGICLAAQLIAYLYGARLSTLPGERRLKGIKRIWNVKTTPFNFFDYQGGRVWSSQRWRITDLPDELECWCASSEGVEVFRHKQKPIYGLQFHPEHHTAHDDGRRIFEKIVELEIPKKTKPKSHSRPKRKLALPV